MVNIFKKFQNVLLVVLYFASIFCAQDSISMNKVGCLFRDKLQAEYEIISFEYIEGYYRAIHANYGIWYSESVKMKYLGDSSKDIFMKCFVAPNYVVETISNRYHYHIPCTLTSQNIGKLADGTYCIEIVKKLVGDIDSENFCSNDYTFKITNSNNIPSLTISGFANGQEGCVKLGDTITLLGKVGNSKSKSEDYGNLGIGLANTELVSDDIPLDCKIEGNTNINSNDKITCMIPFDVPEGKYSIFYSGDLLENNNKCPNNIINNFNSLNFKGDVKKLNILSLDNIRDIEAILINISFENPSKISGLFNLTFSLDNIQNINYLKYENIKNKDIGIQLIDYYRNPKSTKCDIIISEIKNIFYLICKVENYQNNEQYSVFISNEILIGYDQNQIICSYEKNTIYQKIIIPITEYDFFIVYNDDSPYLECNINNRGFYLNQISSVKNLCGSCSSYCLFCKNVNICDKCADGFILKNSNECSVIKEKLNFDKFTELKGYDFPIYDSCDNNNIDKQLFSLQFSYKINNGENSAIDSEEYNNILFAKNENRNFGLKCKIDINPSYIENWQNYGICKQPFCTLTSYLNCSFRENVPNGEYEVQANSNNNLGNLIKKAEDDLGSLKIKYIDTKIIGEIIDDKIIVTYFGYAKSDEKIYVCPDISFQYFDCPYLIDCRQISGNPDETKFECSKEISGYEDQCKNFRRIMMKDECGKYINESFEFKYCPDLSTSLNIQLKIYLFILLFLAYI